MARLLAAYDTALARRRLTTSTISGAILSGAGDLLVQSSSRSPDTTIDRERVAAFTLFGAVLTGPINYVWLDALEQWVTRLAPNGGMRALAYKVALQSSIMQPLIYLPSFYLTNAIVRGWSFTEAVTHVQAEYAATLTRLWMFWTPTVVVAFGALPLRRQAVFFAGVGFCWNVILSWTAGAGPARATGAAANGRLQAQHTPSFARRPSSSTASTSARCDG